ncbi:MAG: acyltransferase [Cellvibrio sp.]|uniref:acyltransferase family protein n=1 Tax=Cellvibrio sp. TaxID=1965322 RepID=UPI00271FB8DD|nr:acyltransferase [Cellvibrio sp.]
MANQDRFAFLDNMKAIAIVMVVAIHAIGYSMEMPEAIKAVVLAVVATIAVPVFFFIDGYLLGAAYAAQKNPGYWVSLKKSAYRLLLPWLIFSILYFVLRFGFEYFNMLNEKHIIGKDITYMLSALYGSVYVGQMYFLVSLFLIRMISPLVSTIFNQLPLLPAFAAAILFIIPYNYVNDDIFKYLYIKGGQEPLTHAIWGLQFYIVGVLLFRLQSVINITWLALPCLAVLIAHLFFNTAELFQWAYLILFFVAVQFFAFENTMVSYVGRNTMGIFLLHSPLVLKMVAVVISIMVSNALAMFIANTIVTLIVTIAMVYAVQKLGLAQYFFGELKAEKRISA